MSRLLLLLLLTSCGGEPPALTLSLRVSRALHQNTASLALWALAGVRTDDIQLPCSSLMPPAGTIAPSDPRVQALASLTTTSFSDGSVLVLDGVVPGAGRVVYAEALDAGGARIGAGCTDGVAVPEGGSVDVQLTIFELAGR